MSTFKLKNDETGILYRYENNDWALVEHAIKNDVKVSSTVYKPYGSVLYKELKIENVIFNGPATIVIWNDGSKTVVKCYEYDKYDPEKGLAMAICKKFLGDEFKSTFKRWMPEMVTEDHDISKALDNAYNNALSDLIEKLKKSTARKSNGDE